MSRYVNIATRVWHDEKFRTLSDDSKTLFLYLLSSPHSNMCGLFYLPAPYACHDLNWDSCRHEVAAAELLREKMVLVDGDIVLIKNFLKYNPIRGPKQAAGAARRLNEVPANTLIEKFMEILKENTSSEDYLKFKDTLSIPYRYPILKSEDTLSIPEAGTDTDTESGTGTDLRAREDDNNEDLKKIVKAFEADIHLLPTGTEMEHLVAWLDDGMESDVIIWAIQQAALQSKRSMSYINAILRNLQSENITSLKAALERERDRVQTKRSGPDTPRAREPTRLSPEEKERLAELNRQIAEKFDLDAALDDKEAVP